MGNRQVVERYARAMADNDLDAQVALVHDDYVARYPQSGELIRGAANLRAIIENYPGSSGHGLSHEIREIIGADDQFVTTPSFPAWTIVHLAGSGDDFTLTGTIKYPSGEVWHAVALFTLREGKVWRETDYFATPFAAPEWRAAWVEREGEPTASSG